MSKTTAWDAEQRLNKKIEEMASEIEKLRMAISETLDENGHLADGENCTLIKLKKVTCNVY